MTKKILMILIFNISVFEILLLNFPNVDFQVISVVSQSITLMFVFLFKEETINDKNKIFDIRKDTSFLIVLIILIGNAIIGVINIIYIFDFIDFNNLSPENSLNLKKVAIYTTSATIIFAQIGGFFVQMILIYFLSVMLDMEVKLKNIFLILGTSYLGFLLVSIVSFITNTLTIENYSSITEFNNEMSSSNIRILLGKFGEYLTLSFAIFIALNHKKQSLSKTTILIYLPNILLLLSLLIFKYLF